MYCRVWAPSPLLFSWVCFSGPGASGAAAFGAAAFGALVSVGLCCGEAGPALLWAVSSGPWEQRTAAQPHTAAGLERPAHPGKCNKNDLHTAYNSLITIKTT